MINARVVIVFSVAMAVAATVAFLGQKETHTASDVEVMMSTDKGVYGSNEQVLIRVMVLSPSNLSNVTFNIWGIRPGNTAHINQSRVVNLKQGPNDFVIPATTPHCTSGCGGVYPGPYKIFAELWFDGEMAGANTTITLEQG